MGAHAGIFFYDMRRPAEQSEALKTALASLAPDGISVLTEEGIAAAHASLPAWSGEAKCRQPLRSATALVLTWDGRLDNRHDLLRRLGGSSSATDDAIALAVVERWGMDALRSLVGEWSLALWDRSQRTLHLARDAMGVRPLYYFASDRAVLWSTSLGELAIRSGQIDALCDAFVAGFMARRSSNDITPYDGIRLVPAATCLSFSGPSPQQRRFWELEPGTVRYRDRRCYEDHLRALWADAVAARLRTEGTVWAELSGGLDSSSVVCMADALIKAGAVDATAIQPLSYVTLHSPEGDERRFIAEVEARIGVRSEIFGVEQYRDLNDSATDWVTPLATWGVALAGAHHVRRRGGRVVLSGRGGDAVMGCQPDNSVAVLEDVVDGAWLTALANLRRWSRACRKPAVEIAWNLTLSCLTGRTGLENHRTFDVDLLTPRLKAVVPDHSAVACAARRVRPSKRELATTLLEYSLGSGLNTPHPPDGVIYTYPYFHRPLLEYVVSIPAQELSAPGLTRALMRRAFEGLVPARILRRVSKGYYPPSAMRSVRALAASMRPVDRLEAVQRGWIDPVRLDRAIGALIDGAGRTGGEVRRVLRLQHWLKSRHRRGPAGIPQREEVNSHAVLNA